MEYWQAVDGGMTFRMIVNDADDLVMFAQCADDGVIVALRMFASPEQSDAMVFRLLPGVLFQPIECGQFADIINRTPVFQTSEARSDVMTEYPARGLLQEVAAQIRQREQNQFCAIG